MALSVIIPTLNEAPALPLLLRDLRQQTGVALEIIVADGGSNDGTAELAAAQGAAVVAAARGRATQMNAGRRQARFPYLLFLHADSRLSSPRLLSEALMALRAAGDTAAGHFGLRFERQQPGHDFFYRYVEGKTRSNRRYSINGDQGLMISGRFFDALGGYDERLPFLEDQRISARITEAGHWILLPGDLVTSARRFECEGHAERYALMALMMGAHAVGLYEFFVQAPAVYRTQNETQKLNVEAFASTVRALIRQQGWRGWRTLYRGGRFVRENAWQLFYRRDLVRNDGRDRALRFHDRWFAPLVRNPLGNSLAMLLLMAWLYLVLPLSDSQRR